MVEVIYNGMNEEQYKIVKFFLDMGSTAKAIAAGFKIEYKEVVAVQKAIAFDDYLSWASTFKGLGL
jgi:hypothetical protein